MGQFICGCILLPHVLVDLGMYLILFTLIFLVSKTFFSFFSFKWTTLSVLFFSNNSVLIFYSFIYYFFENFVCFGHIHPPPIFLRSTPTSTHPSPYPPVCPFLPHQYQFVLPKHSWLCGLPLEYDQLLRAFLPPRENCLSFLQHHNCPKRQNY